MDNAVYTADDRPAAEPRGISLQDYQAITEARQDFLDFLLARTEQPA
ncbi:hypothetical protein ABIB35_000404 [Arthrobacter sp. UYP6]